MGVLVDDKVNWPETLPTVFKWRRPKDTPCHLGAKCAGLVIHSQRGRGRPDYRPNVVSAGDPWQVAAKYSCAYCVGCHDVRPEHRGQAFSEGCPSPG